VAATSCVVGPGARTCNTSASASLAAGDAIAVRLVGTVAFNTGATTLATVVSCQ